LSEASVPWHVARHRLVDVIERATQLATVAGRFAREVVDLSRTEIREVSEQDGHLRGASSTMPQKSNPISCEVVIGSVAVLQSFSPAAHRMAEAEHERAAGEWQIEWYLIPEGLCLAATAVSVAGDIAANLVVSPADMKHNLQHNNNEIMAEAYMMALAPRLGRQAAHDVVYDATRASRRGSGSLFKTLEQLVGETTPGARLAEIHAEDYLGESPEICDLALRYWAGSGADRTVR
jgi:3-carboxy-cis,cis-muconate cycloisomerase